jgi:glycosyltransferase involved in cell wall biosynthesis
VRILAITNLYPNPYHPTRATFNRDQFRELAALHPMAVISPIAWTDELAARWKGDGPLPAQRQVLRDGIAVCHPRYLFPPRVMRGVYGDLFQRCIRPSFEQMLAHFRPEIILGSWAYPDGWAALELGRRAGLPVVIKVHGSDVLTQSSFPARQRKMMETLCAADGVIAVSGDLSEKMIGFGVQPDRIRIVYSGVDTNRFHPGSKSEARAKLGLDAQVPLFLYVGNLFHVKGIDVLVDACGKLAAGGMRFVCQMIGQGPLRHELERQIASLGLQQQVILAGAKPHAELPDWFRAADALVLPSRSEGVPNVLMEAAACGTPFIASHVGGVPEIAHLGRGELIPPGDAEALAGAMQNVLGSTPAMPTRLQQLRSHADAAAEIADFLQDVVDQTRQLPAIAA